MSSAHWIIAGVRRQLKGERWSALRSLSLRCVGAPEITDPGVPVARGRAATCHHRFRRQRDSPYAIVIEPEPRTEYNARMQADAPACCLE